MNRLDEEFKEGHIVGEKGEILRRRFILNGKFYEITGTESTGRKIFDAIESVKRVETGEIQERTRKFLYDLTRNPKKDE